ncbi:2-dehydro-3-deoxyphosphooctonate aldolase [Flavobacterium enshiense]|uniref:2-dehydro-3-deoxyphosphooctonate aldolase n=1 Tax=Flavobacterium enshiense TaxID=1341165 RepID=UPI00345DA735
MLKRILFILITGLGITSCISTKSTIKNIDNTTIKPVIKDDTYQIKEYASDKKYGYDSDYPINIGFIMEINEEKFINYYFNALEGPNGETLTYKKTESCCPFPTANNKIGGGLLSVYEVTWAGQSKPLKMYFNIFERGKIMCPNGLTIKKSILNRP